MPSIYIINNKVEFNIEERTLTSLDDPKNKVVMYAPAARCLVLLLKNRNIILNKEIFYEEVWNKNGVHVTANTFYQNISIIRKCFIKLGLGNEVINTIPRKGLQVSKFVEIRELAEEREEEESQEPCLEVKAETPPSRPTINKRKRTTFGITMMVMIIIMIMIMALYIIMEGHIQNKYNYFAKYKYVKKIGQCLIYTDGDAKKVDESEKYIRLNEKSCKDYKFNYLTRYKFAQRASIIRCENKIGDEVTDCISEYHIITKAN